MRIQSFRSSVTGGALVAAFALGAGCTVASGSGGDAGDVAGSDAGRALGADAGGGAPRPYDAGPTGDRAGDAWEGYIESYHFPSGSDRVRIVFDSATGDGPRTGIVRFGDGALLPPATDPEVGYPADLGGARSELQNAPWEGFEYPISSASVAGARVLVTIERGALWARWCALQSTFPDGFGGYKCLPNVPSETGSGCFLVDDGTRTPVDCAKLHLCFGPACECDAEGCHGGTVGATAFDFHVSGASADGSVTIDGLHNVHFTRL